MNYDKTLGYLKSINQEHLLKYYNELSEKQREILLSQIEKTDFTVVDFIKNRSENKTGNLTPADTLSLEEIQKNQPEYEKAGLQAIKQGKVAAVLLAGGQGSRLGSAAPKGTYNIGITRELSIFACQMENIKSVAKKGGIQLSSVRYDEQYQRRTNERIFPKQELLRLRKG